MSEPFDFLRFFYLITSIVWILLNLLTAGLAFFRFRLTASSLLIGIPFVVLAFKSILMNILHRVVFTPGGMEMQTLNVIEFLSLLVTIFLVLFVGIGVGLIPRSLRTLAKKNI